jgi:pimeloyl-ACP methyl ester carboxylesterase
MFQHIHLHANGLRFHAVVDGPEAGPLVVLLHGFPEHWYSWRGQIPMLAQAGFRVLAPDQRGYNLSDKPPDVMDYTVDHLAADVAGMVKALGYSEANPAIIVGHDWGGGVAHQFAMSYPGLMCKLVILNSPHPAVFARQLKTPRQMAKSWYMGYFQIPRLPEFFFTRDPLRTAKTFFRGAAVNKDAFSDEDLRIMAEAIAQPKAMRCMLNWYRAAFRSRALSAPCPRIVAPTRYIWGEQDVALDISLTRDIAKFYGEDFAVHTIPGSGHWVQNEAVAEVNELLLAFLT